MTQKYEDYQRSAVAGTIALNSTTQVLLSHARAEAARRAIAEDLDLNPREIALFETLKTKKGAYSEALMRPETYDEDTQEKERVSVKLRIELSPFDLEVCTSDPADAERQRRFFEDNPRVGLVEGLKRLAAGRSERLLGGVA